MASVFIVSSSYPESVGDWKSVFVKNIVEAINQRHEVSIWSPPGPIPDGVTYVPDNKEKDWLQEVMNNGGIAHLLKSRPIKGAVTAIKFLLYLRRAFTSVEKETDVYHVNWLQNILAIPGSGKSVLVSVLGTDLKLLKLPFMVSALRYIMRKHDFVLTPNSEWMEPVLNDHFGDIARIKTVPFGVHKKYYDVCRLGYSDAGPKKKWLLVVRLTSAKLGPIFEWAKPMFEGSDLELHLIGPNQENIEVPTWVFYHGAKSEYELLNVYYPEAIAMLTLSNHSEGRPQVLLEAMASGLPIVASNLEAHRDSIEHLKQGMIVDSDSSFRDAIRSVSKPSINAKMSDASRQRAMKDFGTWEDCGERYSALYEELLA